jgi:hypothetical protein
MRLAPARIPAIEQSDAAWRAQERLDAPEGYLLAAHFRE